MKIPLFTLFLTSVAGMAAIWEQVVPANAVRLSTNNRVIENPISDEFLGSVDVVIASYLSSQPDRDAINDAYTSQLEDHHSMTEITPLGVIELAELIFAGRESIGYAIKGRGNLMIKYHANCDSQNGEIHPLLLDFITGPDRVLFVSPPTLLPFRVPLKLRSLTMSLDEWYDCMSRNGVVRYAIIERT